MSANLERLMSQEIGAHAVLLYGSPYAPVLETAQSLAKAWVCQKNDGTGACGECIVCRGFDSGQTPDFQEIRPWGAGELIRVGSIHEVQNATPKDQFPGVPLIRFFQSRPLMSPFRVALFFPFERANQSTSNALLKTLEEPPTYAKIIIATHNFGAILPTIRSRCVCIAVPNQAVAQSTWPASWVASPDSEQLAELETIILDTLSASPAQALGLSARFRELIDKWAKAKEAPQRATYAATLSFLGDYLVHAGVSDPSIIQNVAKAHRYVLGNVNGQLISDTLIAAIIRTQSGTFA